jgi:hypothetical protein
MNLPDKKRGPEIRAFLRRLDTFGHEVRHPDVAVSFHRPELDRRIASQPHAVGFGDIALHLGEALVAGDGGNLRCRASGLGQPTRSPLTQPVSRHTIEPGAPTLLGEPFPKLLGAEAATPLVDEEGDVLARSSSADGSAISALTGMTSATLVFCVTGMVSVPLRI